MRCVAGMLTFLMLIGPAYAVTNLASHPLHTTYSEMEWNPETLRFEVALQLPGFVIDEELSRIHGKRINVETAENAEKLVEDYVRSRFRVTTDRLQECQLHWVGMEVEVRDVWVYFEAQPIEKSESSRQESATPATRDSETLDAKITPVESSPTKASPAGSESGTSHAGGKKRSGLIPDESMLTGLKVWNALLIDGRPDQVNLVNVTIHRKLSSLNLTAEQPEAKVSRLQKTQD